MNQDNICICKPDKLIAAVIYLSVSYAIGVLDLFLFLFSPVFNRSSGSDFLLLSFILCMIVGKIWLTHKIWKGNSWMRFYLLIYCIIYTLFLITILKHAGTYMDNSIALLHQFIEFIFLGIGIFLLFNKETSIWLKQVKQKKTNKPKISISVNISSILLYIGSGLCSFNFLLFILAQFSQQTLLTIFLQEFYIAVGLTINILFIHTIRKGNKLAGIIYLIILIIAQHWSGNPIHLRSLFIFFSACPGASSWGLLGYIQLTIQGVAFVILFSSEVISRFNKLINKIKIVFCTN